MSALDRVFDAVRDVMLLGEDMKRLSGELKELAVQVRDHDRRLIRLETMVEMAGARRAPRRLRDDT